jgi:tRNA-uridine 2-sulfurtransferase
MNEVNQMEWLRDIKPGSNVLMAMSGGVDSSVAAHKLSLAGMNVLGVTMHLASEGDCSWKGAASTLERACCSIGGAVEARKVAEKIGIKHQVIDLSKEFDEFVVKPTQQAYSCGITPNPCIFCNRFIKFDQLFEWATRLECKYIATGHYAKIIRDESGLHLLRGLDSSKDQSYFLSYLTDGKLERTIFPLGWTTKEIVRAEARELGLEVADRPESQDLCFFGNEKDDKSGESCPVGGSGDIVTRDGEVIGHHTGIGAYTIGQRKGLPGGQPEPIYVVEIDPELNRVIVGTDSEGFASSFWVNELSLVAHRRDEKRLKEGTLIQIRYRSKPVLGRVNPDLSGGAFVMLSEPVRAVAPGQVAVFYIGDEVIGAGTISKVKMTP